MCVNLTTIGIDGLVNIDNMTKISTLRQLAGPLQVIPAPNLVSGMCSLSRSALIARLKRGTDSLSDPHIPLLCFYPLLP